MAYDAIVVGAGIQGCGVALRLAQAGMKVAALERAIPGAEASSAAGGILSPGAESHGPGPFLDLARASLARWRAFAEEVRATSGVDPSYRELGTLEAAFDETHAAVLAARAEQLAEEGASVEVLDPAQARALEPALSDAVRGALYFPGEASVDPRPLARGLSLAAAQAGVKFVTGYVRGVAQAHGAVTGVDHEHGRLDAPAVVLAAGSWSALVPGAGLAARAVRPVRGQMVALETRPPLFSRVVFSARGYLVPRPDGRILAGSTMEEAGFEKAVTADGLARILALALEIAPGLARAPFAEAWSNFRPATPDSLPILGESPAVKGLFYATGHYRNGILLAPVTADAVAALVLRRAPPVELAAFSPARLAAP